MYVHESLRRCKNPSDANRINAPWLPTTEPATDRERGDVGNGRGCGGGLRGARLEENGRWTISFNNPGRCRYPLDVGGRRRPTERRK